MKEIIEINKKDTSYVQYVPETFDEFVSLVENVEGVRTIPWDKKDDIVCIEGDEEEGVDFNFYRDGRITVDNYKGEWEIAKDRTPKQMYRIFNDLTREENNGNN